MLAKKKPAKPFEESLWDTATKLRNNIGEGEIRQQMEQAAELDDVISQNLNGLGFAKNV